MSLEPGLPAQASFDSMQASTAADWAIIQRAFDLYAKSLPDRILSHLQFLHGETGGFPVDRLTHVLQTATRAQRDGRDEECGLCSTARHW